MSYEIDTRLAREAWEKYRHLDRCLSDTTLVHDLTSAIKRDLWLAVRAAAGQRSTDEPKKSDAMIAKLTALADTMRHGLHGNLADLPVSPRLDEWIDELDRIIAGM